MKITEANFLVGIDFGDGETTASCIEVGINDVKSLNILNASLPDSQKVESCIYKEKNSEEWTLATEDAHFSSTSLRMNFKHRPSILQSEGNSGDLDALTNFVRIVFNLLLENNTKLVYNNETGERNFYLAIACPSRWAKDAWSSSLDDDTEVKSYLQIIQDIIPVDTIIKESDAAFFHFLDQGKFPASGATSLVIDFGSSTIDYTFFKLVDGEKRTVSDGSESTEFGASKVESAILDYIEKEHQDQFNKTIDVFNSFFRENSISNDVPKWEPYVRHYLKTRKEKYYSGFLYSKGFPKLKIELDDFQDYDFHENSVFFNVNGIPKNTIEDKILKQYKDRIKNEFGRLISKCKSNNWMPDFIMITGGASRMPWVKDVVRDCFSPYNPNVEIEVDQDTPSYVVSHGIVRYLRAYRDFETTYGDPGAPDDSLLMKEIAKSLTDSAIRSILLDAFIKATTPIYSRELKIILKDFEDGVFTCTFRTLAEKITNFKANLSDYFDDKDLLRCNEVATAYIRDKYINIIQEKVQNVFRTNFKLDITIPIQINLSTILSRFSITGSNHQADIQLAYAPNTSLGIPEFVSLDRDRDQSERHYIAEHYPKDLSDIKLSEESWDSVVDMIRNAVLNSVSEAKKRIPFTLY